MTCTLSLHFVLCFYLKIGLSSFVNLEVQVIFFLKDICLLSDIQRYRFGHLLQEPMDQF